MTSAERVLDGLLDREEELTAVEAEIDAAERGAGALLVLEGGAGIGKTRLLASALELARERGMRCLSAVGGELERELPFGVVRQLFEPVLATAGAEERERLLEGAAGLAAPAVDPAADPTEAPATFATLHGLYWLVANLAAERPLVVAVDDAQWADVASLRFGAYLARRIEGLPVLVIAAVRTGERASVPDLVAELSSADYARVLQPRPLGEQAVAALVEQGLGRPPEPEFARACLAATGGNPFLARELALELAEQDVEPVDASVSAVSRSAPEGVERAVLRRLGRLPEGADQLAQAVAVLEEAADLATAAHVAELDADRAAGLVDELVGAGLFGRGTPLRFVHPLVRTAVVGALGPGELDAMHRRAAEVLAERDGDVDRVAAHLAAARPAGEEWVVRSLVEASQRAIARGAPDVAAAHLRRALAEPPPVKGRHDVLLELGVAEVRGSDPRSIEHLEQALDSAGEPLARGRTALALGRALSAFGRFPEAVEVYERGQVEVADLDPELAMELEAEMLGAAPLNISTRALAVEGVSKVVDEPPPDSHAACKVLANLAREEMGRVGSRERAIELAERSLSGGYLMADEPHLTFPYAPFVLMIAGELERALQVYDEALAHARARGAVLSTAMILALRCLVLHNLGRLADAAADGREALDTADTYGAPLISSYAGGFVGGTLVALGELAEAEDVLGRIEDLTASPETFSGVQSLRSRARLRLARGRPEEAAVDLRECGRRVEAWQILNPGIASWRGELAIVEQRLGNHEEAQRLATEQLELSRRWGAPWVLAQALRAAGATADGEDAEALLGEQVETAAAGGARLEQARGLLELGSLLRRSGSRKASREPLRECLDVALACGARSIAERAHEELVASGARPRRLRETGPDALTPAERRVAGMAVEGMTNKAIAQALFVSEKTVETQLGSVYRKMDIGSRSQIAAKLEPVASEAV